MSKKNNNPLISMAQALGQDVGEIKKILTQNHTLLSKIQQSVGALADKTSQSDPPTVVSPPVVPKELPENATLQHYVVSYPSLNGGLLWQYKIPLPNGFAGEEGVMLVKTQEAGKWVALQSGKLTADAEVESKQPCEVLVIKLSHPSAELESPDGVISG